MTTIYGRSKKPFQFCSRLALNQFTGLRSRNLLDLLEQIKSAPESSIFYHTHMFAESINVTRHEFTNEFAYWVDKVLGEPELAEELASIDILEFSTIRLLREAIVRTIEKNLFDRTDTLKTSPDGYEFEFIQTHSFILPSKYIALDLRQFSNMLKKVSLNSVYFHMFEARLRLEKSANDFSTWIGGTLGRHDLAAEIDSIDPYSYNIDELRQKIIDIIRNG